MRNISEEKSRLNIQADFSFSIYGKGTIGFEPTAFSFAGRRSNPLSYVPNSIQRNGEHYTGRVTSCQDRDQRK